MRQSLVFKIRAPNGTGKAIRMEKGWNLDKFKTKTDEDEAKFEWDDILDDDTYFMS